MSGRGRDLLERFMQVHGLLVRQFHRSRMAHGLMSTPYSGQGRVLKFLKLKPEFTQKELAELLGVRPQSLGELLAKLERSGYVTRVPSETDRRVTVVRLTEQGARAAEAEDREDGGAFDCLSPEEQEQLLAYLDRILAALEGPSPDADPRRDRERDEFRERKWERRQERDELRDRERGERRDRDCGPHRF